MTTTQSEKSTIENRNKFGFLDLVEDMDRAAKLAYFPNQKYLLAEQTNIQTLSYKFAERCFGGPHDKMICGKRMQMYLAKIDITEIENGLIDLSTPALHQNKYNGAELMKIINENNKALTYLKDPFSPALLSDSLTNSIHDLAINISKVDPATKSEFIHQFLNLNQTVVAEVILFTKVLNLICISQSLYAFAYQLRQNANFIKILEFALNSGVEIDGFEHITKLADRYYSVFIGNLASRVFSNPTLEIIESAFSAKEKK